MIPRSPSTSSRRPSLRSVPSASPEPPLPEKAPLTAASVARDYFRRELDVHHGAGVQHELPAEMVVILHDSCYGHRYSRPRTSRASLSTIVERPERIKASVLGVSAAYVRLGERHAAGTHQPHPHLDPTALPSLPFRIHKTTRRLPLTSQTVTNVHGGKWMEELKLMCDAAEAKLALNGKELQRPDTNRGPDGETPHKLHEGDLYLCAESLEALESALGGVCEAVDTVFGAGETQRAFVAIRPPGHHCSASYPSGFCWLNNVHVGIMHAILSHGLTHATILDFDLHHGDGSQAIAWQHNSRGAGLAKNAAWWKKTSIGYFSLHDINSYPCEMGDEDKVKNASLCIDGAHGQTVWNVHLQPWKSDAEFWALYETKYAVLLDKARDFLRAQTARLRAAGQVAPRAAIFLSAGFDASEWESAGMQRHNVNVPTDFYARLSRDVVRIAAEEDTSVDGRIVSVLEGGYSDRALCSGIFSHLCGLAGDDAAPPTKPQDYNGLGYEMGQRMGVVDERGRADAAASKAASYDPAWWSVNELERLEAAVAPPPAPAPLKKPRSSMPPTYSSPTQSSTAKVVVAVPRRSMSGLSTLSNGHASPSPARQRPSRPPSPPPPEVPWTTAVHELSKLLIPADRQTASCTAEDLSAEATRQRRDRQSALASLAEAEAGQDAEAAVQLAAAGSATPVTRTALRKAAKIIVPIREEEDSKLGKNRRKTVAGAGVLATEKPGSRGTTPLPSEKQPTRQSRRLSAASTIVYEPSEASQQPLANATNGVGSRAGTPLSAAGPESATTAQPASTNAEAAVPLSVKKTRVTASAKKEPASRVPRAQKKAAAATTTTSARPPTGSTTATPAAQQSADSGIDQITSGMKKIKINIVTKAQREARERERAAKAKAEEEASAGVKSEPAEGSTLGQQAASPTVELPDSIAVAPLPPSTPLHSTVVVKTEESGISGPYTPMQDDTDTVELPPLPVFTPTPAEPRRTPLPFGSPDPRRPASSSSAAAAAQTSAPTTPSDMLFVPYQPDGPTPPTMPAMLPSQPLQWLPPNSMATPMQPQPSAPLQMPTPLQPPVLRSPSPMKRGSTLPVFTATSPIPFAPVAQPPPALTQEPSQPGAAPATGGADGAGKPVWQVPQTPRSGMGSGEKTD